MQNSLPSATLLLTNYFHLKLASLALLAFFGSTAATGADSGNGSNVRVGTAPSNVNSTSFNSSLIVSSLSKYELMNFATSYDQNLTPLIPPVSVSYSIQKYPLQYPSLYHQISCQIAYKMP